MDHLTLVDRVTVKGTGARGGSGPLTFGQINVAEWIGDGVHEFDAVLAFVLHLPTAVTLTDVTEALAVLVARYETLRTRFTIRPELGQHVTPTGELPVDVYEFDPEAYPDADTYSADGDPRVVMSAQTSLERDLIERLRAIPFRTTDDTLVRVAVAVRGDTPVAAAVAYSHLVTDLRAAIVLNREFTRLASAPGSREIGPPVHQPLDQAAAEQEPRRQRRAEAALRLWEDNLRWMPQAVFSLPASAPPGPPVSGWLSSRILPAALTSIADRTRAGASIAIMAAVAAVVALRTGTSRFGFPLIAHNRYGADLHEYVGSIAQDVLIVVDTDLSSFDDLLRQCATATMRATRVGACDMYRQRALRTVIGRERGILMHRDVALNDIGKYPLPAATISQLGGPVELGRTPRTTSEWLAALAKSPSHVNWWQPPYHAGILTEFRIAQFEVMTGLSLWIWDASRVTKAEIEAVLRGVERLLVAAAGGDVALDQLSELTGITPIARDPARWLRVDSCWVEIAEVQRVLDDALAPGAARLQVRTDADGQSTLVAYLAASDRVRTPYDAHTACLNALDERPTAMAAHWYVLCDQAPDNPLDLAAWQRQTVLAEGDGR